MLAEAQVMPLSAVVGAERVKEALLLLAVNPRLGGVLIRGHKGTAKSTLARGLARLLPEVQVNQGCPFNCPSMAPQLWCERCRGRKRKPSSRRQPAPFETVPLGMTEDQLLGTVDVERALRHGEHRFSPGLLARANQGVLYVDEVNLLEDHLVDLVLDAAASGVNVVAREGWSLEHAALFVLVGTMNPDEGALRPQLLDRFGLCVDVRGLPDVASRSLLVERTLAFEMDPEGFRQRWQSEENRLTDQIVQARRRLPEVEVPPTAVRQAAEVALAFEVEGHRADILLLKTALTLAAWEESPVVEAGHLTRAGLLVLPHREPSQPWVDGASAEGSAASRAARLDEILQGQQKKKRPRP
jgi:Mg-chelatase subunit ChlI